MFSHPRLPHAHSLTLSSSTRGSFRGPLPARKRCAKSRDKVPYVISRISHRQTSCCKHVVGALPVSERDKNRQRWSAERRISRNLVVGVGEVKRHNGENTRVSFDIHLGWVARYGKYEEKNRDARRNIWGKRLRTRVCERLPRSS